jgi:hypothetical protein
MATKAFFSRKATFDFRSGRVLGSLATCAKTNANPAVTEPAPLSGDLLQLLADLRTVRREFPPGLPLGAGSMTDK